LVAALGESEALEIPEPEEAASEVPAEATTE
jgi:hypothetical protein